MHIDEGSGIFIDGGQDCVITGNTFTSLSTAAVWSSAGSSGLLITNNLCRDCGRKLPKSSLWIDVNASVESLIKDNLTRR